MAVEILNSGFIRVRIRTRTQMRGAIEDAVGVGLEVAANLCPVSEEEYPGKVHLWETLQTVVDPTSEGFRGTIMAGDPAKGVDYAMYPEFGTIKQAAQPYLGPGYQAARKELLRSARARFNRL